MPIPKPNAGEKEQDFVSRCIGFLVGESKEQDVAAAICYKEFRGDSNSANELYNSKSVENHVISSNSFANIHGDGGWVQLSPYGRFSHPKGDQVFTRLDADELVNQFHAALNLPQRVMGIPWYIGHPDHDAFKADYNDKRAFGRIQKLEARGDGLWGNVRWNEEGKKLITNEAFHGHSVNWSVVKRGDVYRPVALKSVGFTNEPNIPVLPILAANEKGKTVNKDKLCKMLGLDPATATDEQIEEKMANELANAKTWQTKAEEAEKKIKDMGNIANEKKAGDDKIITLTTDLANEQSARKKDVDAEKAKVIEKETALANERKTHVKTALDLAITAGCMPLADRPKWETEFANSHDATLTKLLALKPTIKTSSGVARRDTRTGATSDKREDFMANVRKLQSDGLDYNTAFNRTLKTHGQLLETAAAA